MKQTSLEPKEVRGRVSITQRENGFEIRYAACPLRRSADGIPLPYSKSMRARGSRARISRKVAHTFHSLPQRMRFQPKCSSGGNGIQSKFCPPCSLVAVPMKLTMMSPAQGDDELVADFATKRALLRKT